VDEIKFVLKTFLASLLLISLMQIKIGETTVESRAYQLAAQSKFTHFLSDVAQGAVVLGKQLKTKFDQTINKSKTP